MAGPVGQGDDASSAFIEHAFAIAIGSVVARDSGSRPLAGEHGITRSTVVALEENNGIPTDAFFLKGLDHPADLLVHRGDGGRVGAPVGIGDVFVLVEVFLGGLIGSVGGALNAR